MSIRDWEPVPDEPCGRSEPHIAHRNWRGEHCGVCPGVPEAAHTAADSRSGEGSAA